MFVTPVERYFASGHWPLVEGKPGWPGLTVP
jgi:hypothetical protein